MDDKRQGKIHTNKKYYDKDFSGQDLTNADFRSATLIGCNFDSADLTYATLEGANCYRSTFRNARLYHSNMKDAVLAETKFDPRDMFGLTLSMSCDTWDRIEIGLMPMMCWLYLPLLSKAPDALKDKIRAVIVDTIGEERFKGLESAFGNRQI